MQNNKVIFVDFANKKRYKRKKRIILFFRNLKKRMAKLSNNQKKYKYPKRMTNID